MNSLSGKLIVLTGGAGGIGRTCIDQFVKGGSRVLVVDPSRTALDAVRKEFGPTQCVTTVESRLDSSEACEAVLAAVTGPVYALVHLAGVFEADGLEASYRPVWDRALAANLTTAFDMAAACLRRFDPEMVSRIVLTTSVAYRRGSLDHLGYSAAKGGIAALVRALSRRLAPKVLVNAVAPGIIDTQMTKAIIADRAERLFDEIPLRRWGEASEIASVIRFLCSSEASYITGQIINVDGGMVNS